MVKVPAWNGFEKRLQIPWLVYSPILVPLLWRSVRWCDRVHAHGFLSLSSVGALILARLLNKQSLLTEHIGLAWYSSWLKSFLQKLAICFFGVICVRLAQQCFAYHDRVLTLLRRLATMDSQVAYLPNPLQRSFLRPPSDLERLATRQALGWTDHRPKVLFVGRLVVRKGIDLLLQATYHEYDLVFCGPGDPTF